MLLLDYLYDLTHTLEQHYAEHIARYRCSQYPNAENGRAPYVRRQWSFWSSVLCAKHETWLCARRPGKQFGSERNGWASVLQSDPAWASASNLRYDPALRPFEAGFDANAVVGPTGSWKRLDGEFHALVQGGASILNSVVRPESFGVRARVREAIETLRIARASQTTISVGIADLSPAGSWIAYAVWQLPPSFAGCSSTANQRSKACAKFYETNRSPRHSCVNVGCKYTEITIRVIYPIVRTVRPEFWSARLTIVGSGKPASPARRRPQAPSY